MNTFNELMQQTSQALRTKRNELVEQVKILNESIVERQQQIQNFDKGIIEVEKLMITPKLETTSKSTVLNIQQQGRTLRKPVTFRDHMREALSNAKDKTLDTDSLIQAILKGGYKVKSKSRRTPEQIIRQAIYDTMWHDRVSKTKSFHRNGEMIKYKPFLMP